MTINSKHVSWDIHYGCGYACSYCFLQGKESGRAARAAVCRTAAEWQAAWDRFDERFGPARIDIAGGEPFLYPGFTGLLKHLSQKNEIFVITNFSTDLSWLADSVSPENVRLVLSLHPEHVPSAGEFLKKAAALSEKGFKVRITAVAYPPFIEKVLSYRRGCEASGLKFTGTPFFGSYQGGQYPAAYTEAEKKSLSGIFDQPRHALYQLQQVSPEGLPCNSGVDYCRVAPDGAARPCLNRPPMGDFLSPEFSFLEKPAPCPSPSCHCRLEFEYCGAEKKGPRRR
ncbi:MAG: hypothetical protein A2X35_08265 [Elusimicrobia bacterium GWA2_61_42]|nr:MAG: hypothetical protein A2X35_08265 [Elusimicrobia bacterium GWA2_61_42]OGR79972.1 MAG: hypothetical protein A2X38_02150 [Elusimicrobia bacterium GWC2_61_25]